MLQAGTAVLVDRTGTPRVKCNCGNPLAPPVPISLQGAHRTGTGWPGYAPATVAVVRPGRAADLLTVVDIETGDTFSQSPGGGSVSGAEILVSDTPGRGSRIYRLTLGSRSLAPVTTVHDATGRNLDLYDVAADSHGNVFAEANSELSRIDLATGLATPIAYPRGFYGNALAFDGNDVLFSASDLAVNRFDPSTGAAAVVAQLPASSSGDVVFLDATTLYATVSASGGDLLVRVDVQSGAVKTVGSTKASSVFGLFVDHGKLYGVTPNSFSCRGGDLLRIDPRTARSTRLGCLDAGLGGAATRPPKRTPQKGQTGTPPCTNASVQSTLSAGSTFTGRPICSGQWAVIYPSAPSGDEFTVLLQANGGVWKLAPSGSCSPDIVPSDIYRACATN